MQPQERAKTIVAAFGSTESGPILLAKTMGSRVSQGGHILLTGGSGADQLSAKEQSTVKEQAILGAQSSPWIGVTRGSTTPSHSIQRGEKAFVVKTDLDHKRNCLEACLCDGALVSEGKEGTISEAVFCLWLGKPVVFVGDTWKAFELDASGGKFAHLVDAAFQLVGNLSANNAPLDELFDRTAMPQHLKSSANYLWLPSPTSEEEASGMISDALKWLQEHMAGSPRGYFPNIGRYAPVIAAYNNWVSTV
jgi:predicted Rossmann-fold nucleotide-binding protein